MGVKTDGRYGIHNFGYSGYGPHQMLASLQDGLVEQRVNCKPTHFFYLAIAQQIVRVAGLAGWDRHGPRFTLTANGEAIRVGNFDDPTRIFGHVSVPRFVGRLFGKFFTWRRFFDRARNFDPADTRLFIAVVRASAQLAKKRYPESNFHVLLWDGPTVERWVVLEKELQSAVKELQPAGVSVHRISEAIPDLRANWTHYILSVHDPHPNPLQHDRIAEYLVREFLAN